MHVIFPSHKFAQYIDDNATTRIELATKKEMKDTNIEHTTNLI
jgi:hypothetical protein